MILLLLSCEQDVVHSNGAVNPIKRRPKVQPGDGRICRKWNLFKQPRRDALDCPVVELPVWGKLKDFDGVVAHQGGRQVVPVGLVRNESHVLIALWRRGNPFTPRSQGSCVRVSQSSHLIKRAKSMTQIPNTALYSR